MRKTNETPQFFSRSQGSKPKFEEENEENDTNKRRRLPPALVPNDNGFVYPHNRPHQYNGHTYTVHALERMAVNTPWMHGILCSRSRNRLKLENVGSRTITVASVEKELSRPGSTDLEVITHGKVVITAYWKNSDIMPVSSMLSSISNLHTKNRVNERMIMDRKFNQHVFAAQKAAKQAKRLKDREKKMMSRYLYSLDGRRRPPSCDSRMAKKYLKCFSISYVEAWGNCNHLTRRYRGRHWINSYKGAGNLNFQRRSQSGTQFIQNSYAMKYKSEIKKYVKRVIKKTPAKEVHVVEKVICTICRRSFKSMDGLRCHRIAKHPHR